MNTAALPLLFAGCVAPGPYGRPVAPGPIPTPTLSEFSLDCDPDAGLFTLAATATSWTGGAASAWSVDLQYIEQHTVNAVASAPEPTLEELLLVLDIISDWREQAPGKSTVFTCADAPNVVFTLLDVEDNTVDCRVTGPLAETLAETPIDGIDCVVWQP